jgi:hypothetical protein
LGFTGSGTTPPLGAFGDETEPSEASRLLIVGVQDELAVNAIATERSNHGTKKKKYYKKKVKSQASNPNLQSIDTTLTSNQPITAQKTDPVDGAHTLPPKS